jgi:hypothetical protein
LNIDVLELTIVFFKYDGKREIPALQPFPVHLLPYPLQPDAYWSRRENPSVSIGVSLSIAPTRYDPSTHTSLDIVLTARILESPQPDRPITLDTSLNPFGSLRFNCFKNIICVSNEGSQPRKSIEIQTKCRFRKEGLRDLDVREQWKFITLEPNKSLEVRHEVPRDAIDAAGLQDGEVYRAELTDLGLGTWWWMYGAMDEAGDKKFMRWSSRGVEGEKQYRSENIDTLGEPLEEEMWEDSSEWIMGEDPMKLAIVIEKREAEFEVV